MTATTAGFSGGFSWSLTCFGAFLILDTTTDHSVDAVGAATGGGGDEEAVVRDEGGDVGVAGKMRKDKHESTTAESIVGKPIWDLYILFFFLSRYQTLRGLPQTCLLFLSLTNH